MTLEHARVRLGLRGVDLLGVGNLQVIGSVVDAYELVPQRTTDRVFPVPDLLADLEERQGQRLALCPDGEVDQDVFLLVSVKGNGVTAAPTPASTWGSPSWRPGWCRGWLWLSKKV